MDRVLLEKHICSCKKIFLFLFSGRLLFSEKVLSSRNANNLQ